MILQEIHTSHLSSTTMDDIRSGDLGGITTFSWMHGEGEVLYVSEDAKLFQSYPFDLIHLVKWMRKEGYEFVLLSDKAPVVRYLGNTIMLD